MPTSMFLATITSFFWQVATFYGLGLGEKYKTKTLNKQMIELLVS